MTSKKFWKWFRYYILFCPFHFMIYELQCAITEKEREEFYNKFHGNETIN